MPTTRPSPTSSWTSHRCLGHVARSGSKDRTSSVTSIEAGPRVPEAERDRLSKRNFYRVLKQYATRRDLLLGPG